MKWFLGTVSSVMILVVLVVVGLFVYVQVVLAPPDSGSSSATTSKSVASSNTQSAGAVATNTPSPTPEVTVTEKSDEPQSSPVVAEQKPIPLSSLPLSDTQKKLLAGVGIDSETFVITQAMVTCANEKLGDVRMKEIIGGSAPGALEMASLMRCL